MHIGVFLVALKGLKSQKLAPPPWGQILKVDQFVLKVSHVSPFTKIYGALAGYHACLTRMGQDYRMGQLMETR